MHHLIVHGSYSPKDFCVCAPAADSTGTGQAAQALLGFDVSFGKTPMCGPREKQSLLMYLWYGSKPRGFHKVSRYGDKSIAFLRGKKRWTEMRSQHSPKPFTHQRTVSSEKLKDASSAVSGSKNSQKAEARPDSLKERWGGERQLFRCALKLHLHSTAARKLWI